MMSFMRPDKIMTLPLLQADGSWLAGTVTGGAATDHDDDWLIDGRPGFPARATSTSTPPWVITGPGSMLVNCVVCANHNIDPAKTIAITGGVTVNLAGPALRPNRIPVNAWARVAAPQTTNTLTVTVTSNSVAPVIGEILAGDLEDLTDGVLAVVSIDYLAGAALPEGTFSGLAGYSEGVVQRAFNCEVQCTKAEGLALIAWWEATDGETRPSVLIPFDDLDDVLVGHLKNFRATNVQGAFKASFTFVEYPRSRW